MSRTGDRVGPAARRRLLSLAALGLGTGGVLALSPLPVAAQTTVVAAAPPDGRATHRTVSALTPPSASKATGSSTEILSTLPATAVKTPPAKVPTGPTSPAGPALSILDLPTTPASPKVAPPRIVAANPQQVTGQKTEAPVGTTGAPFGSPGAIQPPAKPAAETPAITLTAPDGVPTAANPTLSVVAPGPVPVGVPDFFIDNFDVPPFLLPIFQAAGAAYQVPWQVLAAINQIETDYGRNLSVSSAGAEGWMQFLPQTWRQYGVDANGAGVEDPYNPADAIFAAARYLHAAGASTNLRGAIFAYNHANWYVSSVMLRAQLIGGLPADLVSSITGLTEGVFPVDAAARYADDAVASPTPPAAKTASATAVATAATATGNAASSPPQAGQATTGVAAPEIDVYARAGASVVAVKDGVITALGRSSTLSDYVKLRDAEGNTYTYSQLKKLAKVYPLPTPQAGTLGTTLRSVAVAPTPTPQGPASAGHQPSPTTATSPTGQAAPGQAPAGGPVATDTTGGPQRLFAYPRRPASFAAGGSQQVTGPRPTDLTKYLTVNDGLTAADVTLQPLTVGAHVLAGTVLGRIGVTSATQAPHVSFRIRPAGSHSPAIDPKPILDGWQLLAATASERSAGAPGLFGPAVSATLDQILLETKATLEQQVLADPSIQIYADGRAQIQAGLVDPRLLASLEFLSVSGLKPTVSALRAGAATPAAANGVSVKAPAMALDISAINGTPLLGHQGSGSIADTAIRQLLTLPGSFQPEQIVSLMSYPSDPNTVAMPDHADRISLEFGPLPDPKTVLSQLNQAPLTSPQWLDLTTRLNQIGNPSVPSQASAAAIPDP